MQIALDTLRFDILDKIPPIDEYHPLRVIVPTRCICKISVCPYGNGECNHRIEHDHKSGCVQDPHSLCPSCSIVAPRKFRSRRNNVHNYDPKGRK